MNITLVNKEKAYVTNASTGEKSWAFKLLFKKWNGRGKKPSFLPIVINGLIDWDDKNIIKQAKEKAIEFFSNENSGLINKT